MERYRDRKDAGQLLAGQLQAYRGHPDVVVLGLPRGGLPVAAEVARALDAPLDIVVVRKVGVPFQPEVAMGALAAATGTVGTVRNEDVLDHLGPREYADDVFESVAAQELAELERREHLYRAGRPPIPLTGRTVILVDDGLATGATMQAATVVVRSQVPARLVVATPVGLGDAFREMRESADEVVCPWVSGDLHSVGEAYEQFDQTTDDEVQRILDSAYEANKE